MERISVQQLSKFSFRFHDRLEGLEMERKINRIFLDEPLELPHSSRKSYSKLIRFN